jgi:2,3-bisphosphoglycerate-dependent phosphoglycerate mutase
MKDRLELWIVRHGQTDWNAAGRLAGWSDVPLTALGEQQARLLRPKLDGEKFDGVWSSDLVRAVSTARLAHGEARSDKRLREINFGSLEGMLWNEVDPKIAEALYNFDWSFSAPDGEGLAELRERVHGFLKDLSFGRHLIFTHGGVIRLLTGDLGVDRFLTNGALIAVDWTAGEVLFVHENESAQ